MKELIKHFALGIKVLIIPYLIFIFLLVYPINFYLFSPGGISEVENLIEIDYNTDKEVSGSISSTYIMSIKRPTYIQFLLGTFTPYTSMNVLTGTNATYTNQEIQDISYLDKETSVNAAIIVAYTKAAENNAEINIEYISKNLVYGKSTYLDHYDEIDFGDELIQVLGDDDTIVTELDLIPDYTILEDEYDFTFRNDLGTDYTLTLSKDEETGRFGVSLKTYYLVDETTVFPVYSTVNSNIGGPSGGLLQTLSIYNMLIDEDLTHGLKIAGTGTIGYDGSVGYIGGVEQKVLTAYLNKVDIFFIPGLDEDYYYDDYQEALRSCEKFGIDPEDWLIPVASFDEAIAYLEGVS